MTTSNPDAPQPASASPHPPASAPAASDSAPSFDRRLAATRERHGEAVPVERIGAVVSSLLGSLQGDLTAADVTLYHEIEDLARYIRAAKAEIAALNPQDIRETFLPTAADELDAIVQSTEQATGEIMDATEIIEAVAADLSTVPGDGAARLTEATTRIYEACSFQDLTGQRITKIVRMLKSIETRIDGLIEVFAPDSAAHAATGSAGTESASSAASSVQDAHNYGRQETSAIGDRPEDQALLNGPGMDTEAMKQDDIDALLASFD